MVGIAAITKASPEPSQSRGTEPELGLELKNIAVISERQGEGIAKQLINAVKAHAGQTGATSLMVGTGNSSLSQLALYQKCGFRLSHVIPDFFSDYPEPIFENGIPCIDMVVLKINFKD